MYNSTKITARFVHCPPFTEIRIIIVHMQKGEDNVVHIKYKRRKYKSIDNWNVYSLWFVDWNSDHEVHKNKINGKM